MNDELKVLSMPPNAKILFGCAICKKTHEKIYPTYDPKLEFGDDRFYKPICEKCLQEFIAKLTNEKNNTD